MAWLRDNGFWALIFVAFIGMHLFGHGAHGAHGGHGGGNDQRLADRSDDQNAKDPAESTRSSGHHH